MEKKYKYWFYYIERDSHSGYELYAYTDNKSYAKMFEDARDKTIFKKEVKEIEKDEVNFLAKYEYSKYLMLLDLVSSDESESDSEYHFIMAVTKTENITISNFVNNIEVGGYLCRFCWFKPDCFTDEIEDALKVLKYTDCNDYVSTKEDSNYPNIKADKLGIFIRYFGKTLKDI